MASIRISLVGVNGRSFTLTGDGAGDAGVYLADGGIDGIWDAPVKTIWNSHAFQKGAKYGGKRILKRDMVLTFIVTDDNGVPWEENDSELRKAFDYDDDATLWYETEGSRRWLKLRLAQEPTFNPIDDPIRAQVEVIKFTVTAGDPFWYEPDVTDTWISPTDSTASWSVRLTGATAGTFTLSFAGQTTAGIAYNAPAAAVQSALTALPTVGAGMATVTGVGPYAVTFDPSIMSGTLAGSGAGLTPTGAAVTVTAPAYVWVDGSVWISNPTDQPIWLEWVLQAWPGVMYRLSDYSFGNDRFQRAIADAARRIVMPALLAGEHLKVNTDEEQDQVVSDIDTQAWLRMRGVSFLYPIPPRTKRMQLPVSVTNAPAGVGVQVRCHRPWSRPAGLQ